MSRFLSSGVRGPPSRATSTSIGTYRGCEEPVVTLFRVWPIFWKGFPRYGVALLAEGSLALICALRRISFFTAVFHSLRVAGMSTYLRMISRASHRGSPLRNFSMIPLSLADHPARATSQSKVAMYVSTSHPFISSCISAVNASCARVVS